LSGVRPNHDTEAALRRRIPESEFEFTFARSGGPGGQNVNKVNTRVTLWFDVRGSRSLTAEERHTVCRSLAGRVGNDGRLRVVALRHRTQRANREAAVQRLYELLAAALTPKASRTPTRIPRGAHERRLQTKRRRSTHKRLRRESPDRLPE